MKKYMIALYIRLSLEDAKTDSMSISSQRSILREYASELPEYANAELMEFWTCQYPFRPKEQGMKGGGFAALAPLQHLLWL